MIRSDKVVACDDGRLLSGTDSKSVCDAESVSEYDDAPAIAASRRPVRQIVERLDALSDTETVTFGQIATSFGSASFLPVLLVPALLLVSPLSGIPFFSTLCGLTITMIALQAALQRKTLWLPGFLMRRSIKGRVLHRGAAALGRVADWLDRNSRERLVRLVSPPFSLGALLLCAVAGLVIPVLELVPFSSSLFGAMVSFVAVGLMVRDGVFLLLASGLGVIAALVPALFVSQVVSG